MDEFEEVIELRPSLAQEAKHVVRALDLLHEPTATARTGPPESFTYARTATRWFEVAYWKTIAARSEGRYAYTNNADRVHDPAARRPGGCERHLEPLGEHLLTHYARACAAAVANGRAATAPAPSSGPTTTTPHT